MIGITSNALQSEIDGIDGLNPSNDPTDGYVVGAQISGSTTNVLWVPQTGGGGITTTNDPTDGYVLGVAIAGASTNYLWVPQTGGGGPTTTNELVTRIHTASKKNTPDILLKVV